MASIKKNIVANLVGKIWGAAIAILLIPQYIKYLGIESYGLIGFYGTLIGSMTVLDLGLSATLNRELAKYKSENRSSKDIRNLTFSLECIYWLIGIIICFLVISFSGFITTRWINVEHLPPSIVKQSVILMGIVIAFQWPISLYNGGLMGLEKQVLNNSINVVMTTIRAAGVIILLKYFSPTLHAFFLWQAAISFVFVVIMRVGLWKVMPAYSLKPVFSKQQIKIVWRFAAGMTGISFITFFLSQLDKIILSKILPLTQFGYYTLAFTVATSITLIVSAVSITFFPRFSRLIASGHQEELKRLYHQACKLIATIIFPICFVLIFFMRDILKIWTHNDDTVANTTLIAQILLIGSILNSLMIMPYNLLIANGWTKFTIYQNSIAAIILVPLLFILSGKYGALGGAFVWVIVNAGYVFISQPLMHRKLLKNELWKWYWNDTLLPMLPSLAVVLLIKFLLQYFFPTFQMNIFIIGGTLLFVMSASVFMMLAGKFSVKKILQNIFYKQNADI